MLDFVGDVGRRYGHFEAPLVVNERGHDLGRGLPKAASYDYCERCHFGSGTQIGTGNYVVYKGTGTSAAITGLVETSTNVAVVATEGETVSLATSQRSSVASEIQEIAQTVRTIFEMGGATVTQGDGYPGWKPNVSSPILGVAKTVHAELFGREPEVKAIHAGLECGIIGEKYPGMEMASIGPSMWDVHTPDEQVSIPSVAAFWRLLTAVLAAA